MEKPNNLKELIKEILYVENGDLRSKLKENENVEKYMTEGLKEWIIKVLTQPKQINN